MNCSKETEAPSDAQFLPEFFIYKILRPGFTWSRVPISDRADLTAVLKLATSFLIGYIPGIILIFPIDYNLQYGAWNGLPRLLEIQSIAGTDMTKTVLAIAILGYAPKW